MAETTTPSFAHKVREFTPECVNLPKPMTPDSVRFIIRMCCSELIELAQTVTDCPSEAIDLVISSVVTDVNCNYSRPTDEIDLVADQADALADVVYYVFNAACKHGVNLSKVLDLVHNANMAKKFPDGTFHRRDDGKIIKPDGWMEPSVNAEIQRQIINGAWN